MADYEAQRAERIARNQAILAQLGLANGKPMLTQQSSSSGSSESSSSSSSSSGGGDNDVDNKQSSAALRASSSAGPLREHLTHLLLCNGCYRVLSDSRNQVLRDSNRLFLVQAARVNQMSAETQVDEDGKSLLCAMM